MTATTASTTADRISQPARDPRLATTLRLIALALGLLAAAAGVAYVFGGEVPKPQGWQNQVLTAIWLMPILTIAGGILGQFYPRTGAVVLFVAGIVGLALAMTTATTMHARQMPIMRSSKLRLCRCIGGNSTCPRRGARSVAIGLLSP